MVVKTKIWLLLRSQFSCFNLCTNKADVHTEKHSLHADRSSGPTQILLAGTERGAGMQQPPCYWENKPVLRQSWFSRALCKPLNHLEHISLEFYNILTQFPHPFHHRLPVRAKDSHKQILWSVSQKGSICKVRPQPLLFLSRRAPFPIMNCPVTKQPWESWKWHTWPANGLYLRNQS